LRSLSCLFERKWLQITSMFKLTGPKTDANDKLLLYDGETVQLFQE